MTSQIKYSIAMLHFEKISLEVLKKLGERIIHPSFRRKPGKSNQRENSFWAGRSALATLLLKQNETLCVKPNDEFGYLEIFFAQSKKKANFFANISHTENMAVAILGPTPVGIDIEKKNRNAARVMKRVLHPNEKKYLNEIILISENEKIPAPILLWSAKEAFSKSLGLGMKFGFQQFEIQLNQKLLWNGFTNLKGPLDVKNPKIKIFERGEYFITACSEWREHPVSFQFFHQEAELEPFYKNTSN